MDHIKRSDIKVVRIPGAEEQYVFGRKGYIFEEEAEMKYCRFAAELGEAPELCGKTFVIYVRSCRDALLRYGAAGAERMEEVILCNDDVIYISAFASARIEFRSLDGYADCTVFSPSGKEAVQDSANLVRRITRDAAPILMKNGRKTYRLMGGGSALVKTTNMSGAFATFAERYGRMESHCHENEYMYVIDAKNAVVSFGPDKNHLEHRQSIHKGDIMRPHLGEWHRFDFTDEDGYVDFCNLFTVMTTHVTTENDL